MTLSDFVKKYLWLIALTVGFIGFLMVYLLIPRRSLIDHPLQMYFKILVFIFIIIGIAFFPNKFRWKPLLMLIPFFLFVGYILPRISYLGNVGIPSHFEGKVPNAYDEFYTHLYLILFPLIICTSSIAYRLGGGKPGDIIKFALSGVIIIFAGTLDLMYFAVNPVTIPDVLIYANHVKAIIGHYPSFIETLIFALCHLPFLIGLWFVPFNKWIDKLGLEEQSL